MKINNMKNLNFRSGLTNQTTKKEQSVNPKLIESYFLNYYNVEASFNKNKSAALANQICANIFEKFAKILNIDIALPPCIKIYNAKNLVDKTSVENFCIPDTKEVLNNDYPYPGRSIFFQDFINLQNINDQTEFQYKNKKTSSSHFLAPFIHEWLHSIQLDKIYSHFGYGGECDYLKSIYPLKNQNRSGFSIIKNLENKKLTPKENEIIFDILGEYSTQPINQYFEIFSETFTKFICDSLKGIELVKNPLELFNKSPKEFKDIVKRIIYLQ